MSDVRDRPRTAPAAVVAHPRIRARRVEVARDLGRRRRRRLNVVLGLVCAGVWAMVGVRSPLLDIDRVQISGAERTSAAEVGAALGAGPGSPLAEVDVGAAEARLEAAPWVDEARVDRLWPGTLRVVLTERRPVATARHPEGWSLIDATGRLLAVTPTRPGGLVALGSTHAAAPGATIAGSDLALLRTVGRLPGEWRSEVDGVRRADDGIVFDLASGACVVVGDDDELAAGLAAAEAVRASAEVGSGARIDVRVPSAPALTPRGGCA